MHFYLLRALDSSGHSRSTCLDCITIFWLGETSPILSNVYNITIFYQYLWTLECENPYSNQDNIKDSLLTLRSSESERLTPKCLKVIIGGSFWVRHESAELRKNYTNAKDSCVIVWRVSRIFCNTRDGKFMYQRWSRCDVHKVQYPFTCWTVTFFVRLNNNKAKS